MDFDPYLNDPDRWGTSLAQVAEIMLPCLDAVRPSAVVEVGAFAGDLTRVLVAWAARSGAAGGGDRRTRADPPAEPRRAAPYPAARRARDRRRPQLPHGERGAAA